MISTMHKLPNNLGGEQVRTQPLSQKKGTGRSLFQTRYGSTRTAWSLKMWPIGWAETSVRNYILRCVICQKSADPIYIDEKPWNQEDLCYFFVLFWSHLHSTQLLRKDSGSALRNPAPSCVVIIAALFTSSITRITQFSTACTFATQVTTLSSACTATTFHELCCRQRETCCTKRRIWPFEA